MTAFGKLIFSLIIIGGLGTAGYFVTRPTELPSAPVPQADQPVTAATTNTEVNGATATTTTATGKKIPFADLAKFWYTFYDKLGA